MEGHAFFFFFSLLIHSISLQSANLSVYFHPFFIIKSSFCGENIQFHTRLSDCEWNSNSNYVQSDDAKCFSFSSREQGKCCSFDKNVKQLQHFLHKHAGAGLPALSSNHSVHKVDSVSCTRIFISNLTPVISTILAPLWQTSAKWNSLIPQTPKVGILKCINPRGTSLISNMLGDL